MTVMANPAHPGEILREALDGLEFSQAAFAEMIGINRVNLSKIINGRAGVSADVDVRLAQVLGTNIGFWVALQSNYDLAQAVKALAKSGRKFKRVVKQAAKAPVNTKPKAMARAA